MKKKIMGLLVKNAAARNVLPNAWHFKPPAGVRLEDVRNLDDLAEHADAWNELFSHSVALSPMLSYPWISAFFKNKVAPTERWICLLAYEGKQLIGVLPLIAGYSYRLPKAAPLLFKLPHDVLHTYSVDALTLPGREDIMGVFFDYLFHLPGRYPFLSFKHLPAHSPTMIYFSEIKKSRMCVIKKPAGYENIMPLPDSAEKYRASLSSKFRQYLNRNGRKLNEFENVNFAIHDKVLSPSENAAKFFEVEHKNWKGQRLSSLISEQSDSNLFNDAAESFAKYDMMHFNFLEAGGKAIAGQYAIRANRALYVLKIGYDEDYIACSPGNILFNKVIEQACDSGKFDELNFMSDSPWQSKWNIEKRPLYNLMVFPNKAGVSALFKFVIQSGVPQKMRRIFSR